MQYGYHVDRENDRFVPDEPDPPDAPKLRGNVIICIASYALWLERQFCKKESSDHIKVNSWRVGYLRRLSWLYYICSVLEVSIEELVEELRRQAAGPDNRPDEKKTINGDVQHFCQSWEEWRVKGPAMGVDSTDGFADWPLEEGSD
jgi:DNA-binding Xre family transcriptional regulator